jgi:VanZ family protein
VSTAERRVTAPLAEAHPTPPLPGEPKGWRAHVRAWLPVVAWAVFIFIMSTDEMSAEHTRGWLVPLIRLSAPGLDPASVELVHAVIRKLGHLGDYLLFALLIDRGLRLDSPVPALRTPRAAFFAAAIYSLSDEAHQAFVASRSASLVDCGIDSVGAALGAFLATIPALRRLLS